jgi:hypothetical protein
MISEVTEFSRDTTAMSEVRFFVPFQGYRIETSDYIHSE